MLSAEFDGVVAQEAVRLRPVTDRLLGAMGAIQVDDGADRLHGRLPRVWSDGERVLFRPVRDGVQLDPIELVRNSAPVVSWLTLDELDTVAICVREPAHDAYGLMIFSVADEAVVLQYSETRVSPAIRSCDDHLLWVRRDHAHRPRAVVARSPEGELRNIYDDVDARFRVSLGASNGRAAVITSHGAGRTEILLVAREGGPVALSVTTVVSRDEGSLCTAVLTLDSIVLLDVDAQYLAMGEIYQMAFERFEAVTFPEGFSGGRAGVVDGMLYVEGRSDGRAAVWCPTWGSNAVWIAPHGGVIQPAGVDGDRLRLGVSSPIHPLQMCIGLKDGSWATTAAARRGLHAGRLWASGRDGSQIPITLFRSNQQSDVRPRPVVTLVYGCYGISLDSMFDPSLCSLIESGIDIAVCHVRGGGEWGANWHSVAKGLDKARSIDDYLACVEHLADLPDIDERNIGCLAGSAGALIAASAMLRRPDLFAAVQLVHPFLTPELLLADSSYPLAASDWEEFGNPETGDGWDAEISPLASAERMDENPPALWIRAGVNDFRAPLWSIKAWIDVLASAVGPDWPPPVLQVGEHAHSGVLDGRDAIEANCLALAWLSDALSRGGDVSSPEPR